MGNAATRVIYVGGGKGGVGRSLASMAVLDWLRDGGRQVVLVEGDQANPDVLKCYENLIPTAKCNFDEYDGWVGLGQTIEGFPEHTIVVNSGARVIDGVRAHAYLLDGYAREGAIDLDVLWPINRLRDSIIALKEFREKVPSGRVRVVRNLFFGHPSKFTRWDGSSYAKELIQNGALVADLEELADRMIDHIYDARMPIEKIVESASMIDRLTINHWRQRTHAMLSKLL
jgi:hypothetical protein